MNRVLTRYLLRQSNPSTSPRIQGFTLIELLVVVVIVAVAAAIAAPSWTAFTNRQKVNKAADRLSSAFQDARSKAKQTKLPHRLTFRNNGGTIEYSVQRTDVLVSAIRTRANAWTPLLNRQEGISSGRLFACTNVASTPMNQDVGASLPNVLNTTGIICRTIPTAFGADTDSLPSIIFAANGGLPLNSATNLVVTIGLNRSSNTTNNAQLIPRTRYCIFIDTLLGSTRTARDTACPSS